MNDQLVGELKARVDELERRVCELDDARIELDRLKQRGYGMILLLGAIGVALLALWDRFGEALSRHLK
jgi:hypothetical protein